jgi:hypothetical protein
MKAMLIRSLGAVAPRPNTGAGASDGSATAVEAAPALRRNPRLEIEAAAGPG